MALPKIEYPILECDQPSTKKKIKFRQMLVKDEKILLMAKTSESNADIMRAVKQVVNNCVLSEDFDVNKATIFDIEYIFLRIRSQSVNNVSKVSYKDLEDNKIYDFEIPLDEINVEYPESVSNTIKINNSVGFTMNYPSGNTYEDEKIMSGGEDTLDRIIVNCMDKIFNGDEMIDARTTPKEELLEFVNSLDVKTYESVRNFLSSMPYIKYSIKYTNELGKEKVINLTTLTDFFTFA